MQKEVLYLLELSSQDLFAAKSFKNPKVFFFLPHYHIFCYPTLSKAHMTPPANIYSCGFNRVTDFMWAKFAHNSQFLKICTFLDAP